MISDRDFVRGFISFWSSIAPFLEQFLRVMNLEQERVLQPLISDVDPSRRALVNELGFRLFCAGIEFSPDVDFKALLIERRKILVRETFEFINQLAGSERMLVSGSMSRTELREAEVLAKRIVTMLVPNGDKRHVIVRPEFSGCGFVDSCRGDLIVGEVLWEIKAGDRNFRSTDLRQILVYLATNFAAKEFKLESVGLINPRLGFLYEIELDLLARTISGRTSSELFDEIVYFISSGDVSR